MSQKVLILQKRAIQSVYKNPNNGSTKTFSKQHYILKLPEIFSYKVSSLFVEYVNKDAIRNDYISNLMQLNSDAHSHISRIRTTFLSRSLRGPPMSQVFSTKALLIGTLYLTVLSIKKNHANFNYLMKKHMISQYKMSFSMFALQL